MKIDEGYILSVGSSMVDAIRPRMEDLLRQDPKLFERYLDARGIYLENEATSLLAKAFPGSKSWSGVTWRSSDDDSDLDGLVAADDLTIRLQCKAGRLTAPARRGASMRMKKDIGDLIEAAAQQHAALAAALQKNTATSIGFSPEQEKALNAPLQLEAIVCLDDVTVWATEAHELRMIDALPKDRQVPWVLSLTDLMAVVDLLSGVELAHYLVRRQRIERDGRISAHDELDWVGHYIMEGLFFDSYFDTARPPDIFRLLSYTEPIDAWYFTRQGLRTVAAPKPSQDIPEHLDQLIRRLERERPGHWIMAGMALLDGDKESRDAWEMAIVHSRKSIAKQGWSNASQVYKGRLGVTIFIDRTVPWPEIRNRVASYCAQKIDEFDVPNWVGIGEGSTGKIFMVIDERSAEFPLTEVFLGRPPQGDHGLEEQ